MTDLQQLIENSRINEEIANKLFEIETEILACQSSQELLTRLLSLIKSKFSLTNIHLLLINPLPISYLRNNKMPFAQQQKKCCHISTATLKQLHPDNKPMLSNQLTTLPNEIAKSLLISAESVAFTPLTLENSLIGSLLFTDSDKDRFAPQLGTLHLEKLAVKVSLCLSNVLIREQLEYMANYDRLTGVANRRLMEESLNEELIRQRRYNLPFAVLFIDCNKFKYINDSYGHDCGDKALIYVAGELKRLIRENDKCFRYAGDEFVVTLAGQNEQEAKLVAHRLKEFFLLHPMRYEGNMLPITISCGVAASDGMQNIDTLLKKADKALYLDKKSNA